MSEPVSKPMLFSGPMVRALLEGRKTQTRRIVKPQPIPGDTIIYDNPGFAVGRLRDSENAWIKVFPKHEVGSEIWVRETFGFSSYSSQYPKPCPEAIGSGWAIHYRADGKPDALFHPDGPWKPSIFMPRWASRITLKVTDVRVQRLQDISEEDARAEGCPLDHLGRGYDPPKSDKWQGYGRYSYSLLWESINGKGSWDANPWVWAYTFEVKRGNLG